MGERIRRNTHYHSGRKAEMNEKSRIWFANAPPGYRRDKWKEWYPANRLHVLAKAKARYDANPEKYRQKTKDWAKANPELHRRNSLAYSARKRGADGSHTFEEWQSLLAAYEFCCAYCGKAGPMTEDHVMPITRGGSDNIENILPACMPCNTSKGNRTLEEWVSG